MADPSITVAGEALVDLVVEPDGRYRAVPGGSPANVAVGLARLGHRTQLLARLGSGVFGRVIRSHLRANRVGLDAAVDAPEPATLAVVSLDPDGRAAYDFYATGTADWGWTADELAAPLPAGTQVLCTGSIALSRPPGATALAGLLRREHARGDVGIVLDPNVRPDLLGSRAEVSAHLTALIRLADVVKVSDEDLAWLAPSSSAERVVTDWAGRGPALVVLTRGAAGALAVTPSGLRIDVPAGRVEVVDTVGAGDAFTAGLIDGLARAGALGGGDRQRMAALGTGGLARVLDRAATVASITCGRRGADPPTSAEVDAVRPGDGRP